MATTDANGNTTRFTYDPLGRQVEEIKPNPDGSGTATTLTTYDDVNDKKYVTNALGSGYTDIDHTTETDLTSWAA